MTDEQDPQSAVPESAVRESAVPESAAPRKPLTEAAKRALAEAVGRRQAQELREATLNQETEHRGRGGLDPVRYNDWEIKGLTSDF
jgi:hypothetical protein